MIVRKHAGTAAKLLCLPLLVAGVASCERSSPPVSSVSVRQQSADEIMKEFQANVDGVVNRSGEAGAPINVSPYVKSAPKHDMNDMHDMHAPDEK